MAGRKGQRALAAPLPLRLNLNAEVPTPFVLPWSWYIKQRLYWQLPKLLSVTVTADGKRDETRYAAMAHEDREFGLRITFNQTTALDRYMGHHLVSVQKVNPMEVHFTLSRRTCPCTARAQQSKTYSCICGDSGCAGAGGCRPAATSSKDVSAPTAPSDPAPGPQQLEACGAKPTAHPQSRPCAAGNREGPHPTAPGVAPPAAAQAAGNRATVPFQVAASCPAAAAAARCGGGSGLDASTGVHTAPPQLPHVPQAAVPQPHPHPQPPSAAAPAAGTASSFATAALTAGKASAGPPTAPPGGRFGSGGGSGTTTSNPSVTALTAVDFLLEEDVGAAGRVRRHKGGGGAETDDGDGGVSDSSSEWSEGPLDAGRTNPFRPEYCSCPCHVWRQYWPDPDNPHKSPITASLAHPGGEGSNDSEDASGGDAGGSSDDEEGGAGAAGRRAGANRRRGGRRNTKRRRRAASPEGQAAEAEAGRTARRRRVCGAGTGAGAGRRSRGGTAAGTAEAPLAAAPSYVRAQPCAARPKGVGVRGEAAAGKAGGEGAAAVAVAAGCATETMPRGPVACMAGQQRPSQPQLPPLPPVRGGQVTSLRGGGSPASPRQQPLQQQQGSQQQAPSPPLPPNGSPAVPGRAPPNPSPLPAPLCASAPPQRPPHPPASPPPPPARAAPASSPRSALLATCRNLGITHFQLANAPATATAGAAAAGLAAAGAQPTGRSLMGPMVGPLVTLPPALAPPGGRWRPGRHLTLRVVRGGELQPGAFTCQLHGQGQALCVAAPEHLRGLVLVGVGRIDDDDDDDSVVALAVESPPPPQAAAVAVPPRAQPESGARMGSPGGAGAGACACTDGDEAAGRRGGAPPAPVGLSARAGTQRDVWRDTVVARIMANAAARSRRGKQPVVVALGGGGGGGHARVHSQEATEQRQRPQSAAASSLLPPGQPPACASRGDTAARLRAAACEGPPGGSSTAAAACSDGGWRQQQEPTAKGGAPGVPAEAAAAAAAATVAEDDGGWAAGVGAMAEAGAGAPITRSRIDVPLDVVQLYAQVCGSLPRLLCLQVDEELQPEEYPITITDAFGAPAGLEACLSPPPPSPPLYGEDNAPYGAVHPASPGGPHQHHHHQPRGQHRGLLHQHQEQVHTHPRHHQHQSQQQPGRPSSLLLVHGLPEVCLGLRCVGWGLLDRAPHPLVLRARVPTPGGGRAQCAGAGSSPAAAAAAAAAGETVVTRRRDPPLDVTAATVTIGGRFYQEQEPQQQHHHQEQPPLQPQKRRRQEGADGGRQLHAPGQAADHHHLHHHLQQQQQQPSRKRPAQDSAAAVSPQYHHHSQQHQPQQQQPQQVWPAAPVMLAPDGRPVCRAAWDVTPLELPGGGAAGDLRPGAIVQGHRLPLAPAIHREHLGRAVGLLRVFVERDGYVDVPTAAWVVALVVEDGVPFLKRVPPHAQGCYFLGWGRLPGGSLVLRVSSTSPQMGAAAAAAAADAAAAALHAERWRVHRAKRQHERRSALLRSLPPGLAPDAAASSAQERRPRPRQVLPYEVVLRNARQLPKSAVSAARGGSGGEASGGGGGGGTAVGRGSRRAGSRGPTPPPPPAVAEPGAMQ